MPEYRLRLSRHRFPGKSFSPSTERLNQPEAVKVLVLGHEARDSKAHGFDGDVGWYSLRSDTNEYREGKGRSWSVGSYPPFWTIAHRVLFETLQQRRVAEPAATIRRHFDEHLLGSPVAFADLSPYHADSGVGTIVAVDEIVEHLTVVRSVQARLDVFPKLVLFPMPERFANNPQSRERIARAVDQLAERSMMIPFFSGRNWKRGQIFDERVRKILRDWA